MTLKEKHSFYEKYSPKTKQKGLYLIIFYYFDFFLLNLRDFFDKNAFLNFFKNTITIWFNNMLIF